MIHLQEQVSVLNAVQAHIQQVQQVLLVCYVTLEHLPAALDIPVAHHVILELQKPPVENPYAA